MADRLIYDSDGDPGIQITPSGDGISISAQDDWCGDTETGFGATVSVHLTREQALQMIVALWNHLKPREAEDASP